MFSFIQILIIVAFCSFIIRHWIYIFTKKEKLLIKYNFYKIETPIFLVLFFIMIYFCSLNTIYITIFYFFFFLIILNTLYYFIPFYPKEWRYQMFSNTGSQHLLMIIHLLLIIIFVFAFAIENNIQ